MSKKNLIVKIASISFVLALLVTLFTIQVFAANKELVDTNEAVVIEATNENADLTLTWHQGFIMTPSKTADDYSLSTNSAYGYTDVLKIIKKGSEITFVDNEAPLAATGYVISSWSWDGEQWMPDEDNANYPGATNGTTRIQTTIDGKTTYKYITSKDNEYIRICYRLGATSDSFPTIHCKLTNEIGTFQKELDDQNSKAIFNDDTTISNIVWSYGAIDSDIVSNGYDNRLNVSDSGHAYSSIITVPNKGTTIGYTVSKPFATDNIYAFSVWTKDEGENKYHIDLDAHSFKAQGNSDKLTYVDGHFMFSLVDNRDDTISLYYKTQKDNENIRICYKTDLTDGKLPETFPTVHWYTFENDSFSGLRLSEIFKADTLHASNGIDLLYRLYIPMNYDPNKSYPVVLFLHGAGQRGNDNYSSLTLGIIEPFKDPNNPIYESIVIAPQCPAHESWGDYEPDLSERQKQALEEAKDVGAIMELINLVKDEYNVDSDRVYVTGLSMGGYGTWRMLYKAPDTFAAGIVVCGGCDPKYAEILKDIPIKIFHGSKDDSVPIEEDKQIYNAIKELGGDKIEFKTFIGGGHGIWDYAYRTEGLFDWLFAQKLSDRIETPETKEPEDPTPTKDDPTDVTPTETKEPTEEKENKDNPLPVIIGIACAVVVGLVIRIIYTKKQKKN